jgi:hypothetical protein
MVRIILGMLCFAMLVIEISGCATACQQSDTVCKEKQTDEYSRPFYMRPDAR